MLFALLCLTVAQMLHVGWERHQQALAEQEWRDLFGD